MAMDATVQIRMNSDLKTQVEELYHNMGTSFAEAVRVFAQQSLREGGMPFRPTLKAWEDMTAQEINAKLLQSEADISQGHLLNQEELDRRMKGRFAHGARSGGMRLSTPRQRYRTLRRRRTILWFNSMILTWLRVGTSG